MKKLDIIIPVSAMIAASVEDRLSTLRFAIENFYGKQTNIDLMVTVVEQSLDGTFYYLPHLQDKPGGETFGDTTYKGVAMRLIPLRYPTFNKAWCCNVGVLNSRGENICISESDMYCENDYFRDVLNWMDKKSLRWAFGWAHLYYTEEPDKASLMAGNHLKSFNPKNSVSPKRGYSEGGMVFFKKELYSGMGWANEWLEELGGPDNDLAFRAEQAAHTYDSYPMTVYHLWHHWRKRTKKGCRKNNIKIIHAMRANFRAVNNFLRKQTVDGDNPWAAQGDFFDLMGKPK